MGELLRRGQKGLIAMRYYDRNGRRHTESCHTSDMDMATRLLKDRESAIAKGSAISPAHGKLRCDQLFALVVTDYTVNDKDSTVLITQRIAKHLDPWFATKRASSVTTEDIKRYIVHRKAQGAAKATINRELAIINRGFVLALQDGKLLSKPYVPRLKENNARTGFFEREAFDSIRTYMPADYDPIMVFAYYTGWRMNAEILQLEKRDIDRKSQVIRLRPELAKNETGRVFTYGVLSELKAAIDKVFEQHDRLAKAGILSPWLWVRWTKGQRGGKRQGSRIRSIRGAWQDARVAAGQPGRLQHDYRRTAVRNLENAGVPRSRAMAMVGHKTESIYRRYAIVNEADLTAATAKLAAAPTSVPGHKDSKTG